MRKLAVAVVVLAACSKKGAPDEAEVAIARRLAGDQQALIEQALADAKARAPARQTVAALHACQSVEPLLPRLHASEHAGFAVRLGDICHRELPLAELAAAVASVEGDDGACAAATDVVKTMTDTLFVFARADDESKQLAARFAAKCG